MQAEKLSPKTGGPLANAIKNIVEDASLLEKGNQGGTSEGLASLSSKLLGLMNLLQESDMPVTTQAANAVASAGNDFNLLNTRFNKLNGVRLKLLNEQLAQAGLDKIIL
jgi:hypothetical protein